MEERRGGLFQYVLVLALIGAAFWTGTLYQQVKMLRSGTTANANAQVAGTQTDTGDPQVQKQVVLEGDDWKQLLDKPAATMGKKSAKVVMVEFTDYQCPFCEQAFQQTFPQIKKDYVDSGKVFYVLRDMPLSFHPNAKPGALAARCAGEQNKYVEMHDTLFGKQSEWVNETDVKDKFVGYAKDLGLNVGKFTSCYTDKKYEKDVDADIALAGKVGVTGTPTFFIDGKEVVGAQPVGVFTAALDEALK